LISCHLPSSCEWFSCLFIVLNITIVFWSFFDSAFSWLMWKRTSSLIQTFISAWLKWKRKVATFRHKNYFLREFALIF
jgi:hypothetical protein